MKLIATILLCLSMTGCAFLQTTGDAAKDLLVLRVTYETPARQAGVLEEANAAVQRLDEAIADKDPKRVRAVLLSLEPLYREIYASVELPTPEQVAFHDRVQSLWEYLDSGNTDAILAAAEVVIKVLATRL